MMTAAQLAATFQSGDDASRTAAAQTLAALDPAVIGDAAPALAQGAGDPAVAEWCVAALEEMASPTERVLPQLAMLLSADASDTVYWAATLIGRAGEVAAAHAPALAAASRGDATLAARERAVWALGKIGPGAAATLPTIEPLASSDQPRLARLAKQAVESIKR